MDVVSGYLKLQKAGINFKAPCPFHNEKTPSFFVSPERQMWKCFGCGKGGSIFDFIMEIEGVEFPEALKILAVKAGVELEVFDSSVRDSKDCLYEICEAATCFFEKQLSHSDTGKIAFEYLKKRGLKPETIAQFRLGFAPASWDSLSSYLRNSGYKEKEIVDAGMVVERQETSNQNTFGMGQTRDKGQKVAGIYDRFRSRIMFPISDINSRVVGFTGRIFSAEGGLVSGGEDHVAKYINTPQTLIYDKSRILYGLSYSRGDIRKNNKCLLVEGNMDAIMSYQAGVSNVVASSGTALTPMHLAILKRYTTNLDFCFDTDSAGALATKRGIGMALAQDFNVKVVSMNDKECKDPADYVKKYGHGWTKVVFAAQPVVEFYFDRAKESYNPHSAESKKNVILTLAPFIQRLSSKVEKSHWVSQLAFFLRIKEEAIESDIAAAPDGLSTYENAAGTAINVNPARPSFVAKVETLDVLNEALLSIVIKSPALFKEELLLLDHRFLNSLASQVIVELVKHNLEEFNFNNFVKNFDSDKSLDLEFVYLKSQILWDGFHNNDLRIEFSNILNKLKQKSIHSSLANLGYEMRAAEAVSDKAKIADLANEFNQLTQELAEIHKI